jgi:hypothetical protein
MLTDYQCGNYPVDVVKDKMKVLWKNIFHDTDVYINLIFDNYFNPELIDCVFDGDDLVAMMLGIPYDFLINGMGKLKGLYLCGLATKPEYRCQSIMGGMINRMYLKAYCLNYDFTFLIPASQQLNLYYSKFGYIDVFKKYIIEIDDNYILKTNINYDINGNKITIYSDDILSSELNNIICFIKGIEERYLNINISHSFKDIKLFIHENINSGGVIIALKNKDSELKCVAIVECDDDRIIIKKMFTDDINDEYAIIQYIKNRYKYTKVYLYSYPSDEFGIIGHNDFSKLDEGYTRYICQNYGMVKFLDYNEILKFMGNCQDEFKYSILSDNKKVDKMIGEWFVKNKASINLLLD